MPKENMDHDHCCDHGCCNYRKPVWRLVRVLAAAAILLLVLALGVAAGRRSEWRKAGFGPGMGMPLSVEGGAGNLMFFSRGMMANSQISAPLAKSSNKDLKRVAGIVSAVEPGKVTITDNGGGQQVIYTTAETTVASLNGEIPVSSLKAKQFVNAFVVTKDGKTTADFIQVVQ